MAGNGAGRGVSVASRVLALLGAFDGGHQSLRLSQLARRAGLPLATAHRLAAELVAWGALERLPSGEYVVGRRMWDLGLLAPVQAGLRQQAAPFLQDLYGSTLATVHLAVRDGSQALYLDRISGHASVPMVSYAGARLPLHATGVGKVLLAYAPGAVQAGVLANLARVTPYTVTHPGLLREQLRGVRQEGYARTNEEMSLGACSAAVPVRVPDGTVTAALGIVVRRLGSGDTRLLTALRSAADGIGAAIAADPSVQ
jgi:DNA-binding IclR family transcriptional regulator